MATAVPPPDPPPSREELLDPYKIAMDEYRFQVNLNWNRTQYYLALNVGILGIAAGIIKLSPGRSEVLPAALLFVGFVCCALSLAATQVQQGYYHEARSHKARVEQCLGLGALSLTTTPGMGSVVWRIGKVTTFNRVLLGILAAIDLVAFITLFARL